jgi:hypothetical protein
MTPDQVWQEIWPVAEQLLSGTLAEDEETVAATLWAKGEAAQLFALFGLPVFDILLKTVLGRGQVSVTRAIETDEGKFVHLEFVWPDPETPQSYTAADLVALKMRRYRQTWQVVSINPAAVDLPLTEARAAAILANTKELTPTQGLPAEPWILPVALYGGALQITLRPAGMRDEVERMFLPAMQAQAYGVLSLLGACRLWRDFRAAVKNQPALTGKDTAVWSAAVTFIANEQALRQQTQAQVGQQFKVSLAQIAPRVRLIKQTLNLADGLDARYTAVQSEQIVLT